MDQIQVPEQIFGWRRFTVIVLALLLAAIVEVVQPGGISSNLRDGMIGILAFYFTSNAMAKMSQNTGKEA